jgi:hypothetical protein
MAKKTGSKKVVHTSIPKAEKLKQLEAEKAKHADAIGPNSAANYVGKQPLVGILAAPKIIYHAVKEKQAHNKIKKVEKDRESKHYTK